MLRGHDLKIDAVVGTPSLSSKSQINCHATIARGLTVFRLHRNNNCSIIKIDSTSEFVCHAQVRIDLLMHESPKRELSELELE